MTTLQEKVTQRLIKNGNNVDDVQEMISLHFNQASKQYTSVNSIANLIRTIY